MRKVIALAVALVAAACTEREPPREKKVEEDKPRVTPRAMPPPVKPGVKIACANLFTAEQLAVQVGRNVEIKDVSTNEADATSICRLMTVGKPPSESAQARMEKRGEGILGVLPGDELCQVTFYCWWHVDEAELTAKCKAAGDTPNSDVGDVGCVRAVQAGEKFRHQVTAIDPDTRCRVVANGGPSVTDLETVKTCARAALTSVGPSQIKVE